MSNAVSFKSSVNIKAAGGDPKKVAVNLAHDGDEALFATVFGRAEGLGSRRENPREPGQYMQGLIGYFEAVNPDNGDRVASKTLYAPDAIHDQIAEALKAEDRTGPIEFAFESYVRKGGTAGFTWRHEFVTVGAATAEADPLAHLKSAVSQKRLAPPQLQSEEQASTTPSRKKRSEG